MTQKFCAVFPGQGSQSVGMLADLAEQYPVIQATFAEASDILLYDLWELVSKDSKAQLNLTEYTQPAMLVAGVACWRLMNELTEHKPAMLAGHSLGEWSALVASEAISFADAVRLVQKRAQLMQSAVPASESGMAAIIGLEDEQIIALCEQASGEGVVEAANFNSPGQIVVAGNKTAVNKLIALAKDAGAKRALPLSVSVPSHSSLLIEAGRQLGEEISSELIKQPVIPLLHNVDARQHNDAESIIGALSAQIHKPVLWVDCVNNAKAADIDTFIEIGPGKVLAGLCKRIDRRLQISSFDTSANIEKSLQLIAGAT